MLGYDPENPQLLTSAAFHANRASLGLLIRDVAEALGVTEGTVKNWENPALHYQAPREAWEFLAEAETELLTYAGELAAQAERAAFDDGNGGVALPVLYARRNSEELHGCTLEWHNRAALMAAQVLQDEGRRVCFVSTMRRDTMD